MTSPEGSYSSETEKDRLREEYGEDIAAIERRVERAAKIGIDMSITVYADAENYQSASWPVLAAGSHEPVYAASLNKLLIADYTLATNPGGLSTEAEELVVSMLQRSDNDATERLKEGLLGGVEAVNDYAESLGLHRTRLLIRPDGTSHLGYTTASEAIKVLHHLLYKNPTASGRIIYDALANNTSSYGVRTVCSQGSGVILLNKTGDFYGEKDPEIGYAVHHDVGFVTSRDPQAKPLLYGITTKTEDKHRAWWANQLVAHTGADLLHMAGGRRLGMIGRLASLRR